MTKFDDLIKMTDEELDAMVTLYEDAEPSIKSTVKNIKALSKQHRLAGLLHQNHCHDHKGANDTCMWAYGTSSVRADNDVFMLEAARIIKVLKSIDMHTKVTRG